MAVVSLAVDLREFDSQVSRMTSLISSLNNLSIDHRKLVAEIMMVRLFLMVENTIQSACAKLLCGATYLNASQPLRLVSAKSSKHAFDLMRNHARTKPKQSLSWNQSPEIRDNLRNTLSPGDPLFQTISNYGTLLTDMRYIRNHIAHKNSGTLNNFRKLVRKHYGGLKPGVSPGLLLLTPYLGPPVLLEQYMLASRIMIKSLVRG
jgi:hypothetical protein